MPGLLQGLEIGRRALMSHQLSLTTTGHNIANVDTPGYSRQRVMVSATLPEVNPIGVIGTGVQIDDVKHVRDLFLGQQYRRESKALGQWSYREKVLTQIETMFSERTTILFRICSTSSGIPGRRCPLTTVRDRTCSLWPTGLHPVSTNCPTALTGCRNQLIRIFKM